MLSPLLRRKYTHYFNLWDANGDHFMEFDDYLLLSRRVAQMKGIAPNSPAYEQMLATNQKLWEGILQFADKNNDGKVSLDEWVAYCAATTELLTRDQVALEGATKQFAQTMFSTMDLDEDGQVSADEWHKFTETWGIPGDAQSHFRRLDLNGDGCLTLEEVMELYGQFLLSDDPAAAGNVLFGDYE